jgi:farnesyl diphosphate synthase
MTIESPLRSYMAKCQARIESALESVMPPTKAIPSKLHEAMRYSTLGGGKRIRPILVYAAGQAAGSPDRGLDMAACAVELIHAYSLIHDDLPAMDDDDLRRNRPTCHRAFDEATAILAGDALQTLAFQVLTKSDSAAVEIRLKMVELLAIASGSRGMAGGQAMDLEATGQSLNLTELENLHIHKTGALIRVSLQLGGILNPQLETEKQRALDHYGKCIGLAFQIRDDILDIEGDTETLGKTQGKDQAQDKQTYPALMGLNGAKERAQELLQDALACLEIFGKKADPLRWVAEYITGRNH